MPYRRLDIVWEREEARETVEHGEELETMCGWMLRVIDKRQRLAANIGEGSRRVIQMCLRVISTCL